MSEFKIGEYVKVHPASDWFMRGVRYGTVVKIGRKYIHVEATGLLKRPVKLLHRNVVPNH